jgi:ATP-binding cassette, subfamily G (WHITE), member 2, SNQ2
MLDAIGAGASSKSSLDWAQIWNDSAECHALKQEISQLCDRRRNSEESALAKDNREYAMPMTTQIIAVTKRTFASYWRDPNYLLGKCHPTQKMLI